MYYFNPNILWSNRFNDDEYEQCLVTVDGVDFPIREPTGFDKKWYSHKSQGAGLRYELGVCIKTGDIVEFHGPFPCGSFPDLKIFCCAMKCKLGRGEHVIADRGYRGDMKVCTPYGPTSDRHLKMMNIARARHETINGRLKKWDILGMLYHHNKHKHHLVFRSVIVLEQVKIENGHSPFQVLYKNSAIIIT